MSKKSNTPKRKRLNRHLRLSYAKKWVRIYTGKNIISGYSKWFGVDKICAINELKIIGVMIPKDLEMEIRQSTQTRIELKRKNRENRLPTKITCRKNQMKTLFLLVDIHLAEFHLV